MSHTDQQLATEVREAVRSAPLRPTVPLDEVVAVGRRQVRARRSVAAGGVLVAAAVAGAVAFSLGGVGRLGAAPLGVAGEGGPSVTLTEAPDSALRLVDALDARLDALGIPTDSVQWYSGPLVNDSPTVSVESAFWAGGLDLGFELETARTTQPIDVSKDLCEEPHPEFTCTQTALADGSQLVRVETVGDSSTPDELRSLQVFRPGGWVRVDDVAPGPEVLRPEVTHGTEEQLLEIVTDPALQW